MKRSVLESELENMICGHLNELSPDYIRAKADKAEKFINNKNVIKRISAWQYAKCLRQISDFRKIADDMVAAINAGNIGSPDQPVPSDTEIQNASDMHINPVPDSNVYSSEERSKIINGARRKKTRRKQQEPIVPHFPDEDGIAPGKYIVRYISSIDDDTVSVCTDAISIIDAIDQMLREFWDIKEITDVYLEGEDSEQEQVINPADYNNIAELGNAVAQRISDGEFTNLPDLVADVHDDQTTEDCADGEFYNGVDINGHEWSGIKSSYREVFDENPGMYSDKAHDYDVTVVTKVNENGTDDTDTVKFNRQAFKKALHMGIVHFQFTKKNGTERQAFGTTNDHILEENGVVINTLSNGKVREFATTVTFYDLTVGGWRRFSNESLTLIYDESY